MGTCVGRGLCSPGSHRGGAPTTKPKPSTNRRSSRTGCEGGHAWGVDCARPVRTEAVLLVSLPECWLATNTLVGRKPVALLRAMTLRRRSGSDLSLNLYGIRALPKRDEAA